MRPHGLPIAHFIQFRDLYTVLVCWNVFCYNIHRYFAEKEICADSCRCCDTGGLDHIPNDCSGEVMGGKVVGVQIVCYIHEHFVNGVNHNVLRRNIFQVNLINLRTVRYIVSHTRRCDDEINR